MQFQSHYQDNIADGLREDFLRRRNRFAYLENGGRETSNDAEPLDRKSTGSPISDPFREHLPSMLGILIALVTGASVVGAVFFLAAF